MASRRRRRRKGSNTADEWESSDEDTIDEEEPPFDPELILTEEIPPPRITDRSFQPAGMTCWRCHWLTKKKGFNGRQALRAHYRVHSREDRAARRALIRHTTILVALTVATVVLALGIAG